MWNWLKNTWDRYWKWDYIDNHYRREIPRTSTGPVNVKKTNVQLEDAPPAVAGEMLYPVDPSSRWAFYKVSTGEVLKHNIRWPRADGGEIVGLDPDIVPLLEVDEPQPAYDSATQAVERADPVVDVANNTHTHGWTVRDLTQEELDAKAAQAQHNADRDQAKATYAALKAHSGTADERATRLENVVAWMLKDQYGAS